MTSIMFHDCEGLGRSIWLAKLEPDFTELMRVKSSVPGTRLVIGVREPEFDAKSSTLKVPLKEVVVLVDGDPSEAVLISTSTDFREGRQDVNEADSLLPIVRTSGDELLIELCRDKLDVNLANAAIALVKSIRSWDPNGEFGESNYKRKFVNRPNNFVTMKVQPRNGDILITVYGSPLLYANENRIDLDRSRIVIKSDQHGYSRFNWSEADDLEIVDSIVKVAHKFKNDNANRRL